MVTSVSQTSARVRDLNDRLRKYRIGGRVVMTQGIAGLGEEMIGRIDQAIRSFDAFTSDNDPYGEHDFGMVQVGGHTVMFKIDLYEEPDVKSFRGEAKTVRLLTIMLAEEY